MHDAPSGCSLLYTCPVDLYQFILCVKMSNAHEYEQKKSQINHQ